MSFVQQNMFINSWKSWLFLYSWISWPLNIMGRQMLSADSWEPLLSLWKLRLWSWEMQACFHSCAHGCWNLLACRYISESTVAVAISFILYFYPSTPPAIFAGRRLAEKHSSDKNIAGTVEWFLLFSTIPALVLHVCVCVCVCACACVCVCVINTRGGGGERERERGGNTFCV